MLLMGPPEGILLQNLILLIVLSRSPTFVISQSQTILLEQGINTWDTVVPAFFQVIERQTPVLGLCFLPFQSIFSPDPLRVQKLTFPGLDVTI
jgi:hypothetical protein